MRDKTFKNKKEGQIVKQLKRNTAISVLGEKNGIENHLESVFQATYLYLFKITEIQKMTKTVHADEKY